MLARDVVCCCLDAWCAIEALQVFCGGCSRKVLPAHSCWRLEDIDQCCIGQLPRWAFLTAGLAHAWLVLNDFSTQGRVRQSDDLCALLASV